MSHIIPAIIPDSIVDLGAALERVAPFAREVQVDIVDGSFVPFRSWPYQNETPILELQQFTSRFDIEVDLMIDMPERVITQYADAGVKRIVVHMESTKHICDIIEHYAAHSYSLGLSITNDTSIRMLSEYIPYVDFVQLMGIRHIGSQGQPFDDAVLSRITELRDAFPSLQISIDGSVNKDTLSKLREAGANRFVAGSAIFGANDPERAFRELESLVA